MILLAKAMRVSAVEQTVSPCIAVHAVPVLVAGRSEMPDLVTSVASGPGLKVLGAGGVDVPSVATHCWSAYVRLQPGSLDSLILRQVVVRRLRIRANYQRVYIHKREV